VNVVMNIRVPLNALKLSGGFTTVGLSIELVSWLFN
jgi:hypothetical protein